MQIEGKAICLGEDIDTDIIIAGRYLRTKDRNLWATHVFEDLDPGLAGRLEGTVIVAGKNFGCGSSREQAPVALKEAGVRAVIAPSFARIFFRNSINIGLPVIEAVFECIEGEKVKIDLDHGDVQIGGHSYRFCSPSPRVLEILRAGGLVSLWRDNK